MITQPTYRFMPRRRHRPLAFIYTEWRRNKNGEKPSCFYDRSVIILTFFSMKFTFWGYHAMHDISSHRRILAYSHHRQLVFVKTEHRSENIGEKTSCTHKISLLLLTYFQLNCYFLVAKACSVILQPTDGFLSRRHHRPFACIKTE